jgi:CheY-like chemotaxis protein
LDGVAAAVSQVQLSEFDLVFCDLMMEDVEGKPWYEFLARAWPGVQRRLVVMTGGAFSPLAREFAIRNVDRLVEKPFDIAAEVSRRMLDRRAEIET